MIRTTLAAIALCLPAAVAAHSFWLQPEEHAPDPGEEVRVDFKVGDAGEAGDWGLYWERIASLHLFGPGGVTDMQHAVRTTAGDEAGGAVVPAPTQPGSYVLAFASNPSFSDLEAERFDRYVEHEGLSAIAAHRAMQRERGNGTELYARRAKALFQVGAEPTGDVTRPVGQTLEIVPLENPFALGAGETLPVQVLWRGKPLEGASLAVVRPAADFETEVLLTDGDGRAAITLKDGSRYLLSVVWGVPAPNDARADYFTIFASLTFPAP